MRVKYKTSGMLLVALSTLEVLGNHRKVCLLTCSVNHGPHPVEAEDIETHKS